MVTNVMAFPGKIKKYDPNNPGQVNLTRIRVNLNRKLG